MTTDSPTPASAAGEPQASSSGSSTAVPRPASVVAAKKNLKLTIPGADGHHKILTLAADFIHLDVEVKDPGPDDGRTSLRGHKLGFAPSPSKRQFVFSYHQLLWLEHKHYFLEFTWAERHGKHRYWPKKRAVDIRGHLESKEEFQQFIDTAFSRAYGRAAKRKRAMVLINPHAGPGGALQKFEQDVAPLFHAAHMVVTARETTHSGEAVGIVSNLNIDDYDTVIACSGDGLPYEIFNGLAQKPDARVALSKIAVSQIPCGSGNAMACNLYGSPHPSEAALGIIKGVDTPVDLASVTFGNERKLSFLSQSVGIIAEADLGTEHMRWMGAARFNVGVLTRILKKRAYPCDIAVKVAMDDKAAIRSHYKKQREMQSGLAAKQPTAVDVQAQDQVQDNDGDLSLPPLQFGSVNDPLPGEGWEHIKYDNMGNFYCGKMAWVAPDAVFFPAAVPDDGYMDLVTCDSNLSVRAQLEIMMGIGDGGSFFDHQGVVYRKISAVRITPRDQQDGYISIDGEKIPFGPFQVEVHPKLGKVYSINGGYVAKGPPGWEKAQ